MDLTDEQWTMIDKMTPEQQRAGVKEDSAVEVLLSVGAGGSTQLVAARNCDGSIRIVSYTRAPKDDPDYPWEPWELLAALQKLEPHAAERLTAMVGTEWNPRLVGEGEHVEIAPEQVKEVMWKAEGDRTTVLLLDGRAFVATGSREEVERRLGTGLWGPLQTVSG